MGGPRRPKPELPTKDAPGGSQEGGGPQPYCLPDLTAPVVGELTPRVLEALGVRYALGDSDLMAASACWSATRVYVSHDQLRQWLSRGRKELALHEAGAGELTLKAQLVRVWAHARGYASRRVLAEATEGVRQRVPPKWYQSELIRLDPAEFLEPLKQGGGTGGFRLMGPEEAEEDVANKMSEFLARRAAEASGG